MTAAEPGRLANIISEVIADSLVAKIALLLDVAQAARALVDTYVDPDGFPAAQIPAFDAVIGALDKAEL